MSWLAIVLWVVLCSEATAQQPSTYYYRPVQAQQDNGIAVGDVPSVLDDGAFVSPDDADDEEPLVTDRPDFTEASSSVGAGRVQLESGYTFTHDNDRTTRASEHQFPEFLLRVGLTDEVELRIGWLGYLFSRELDRPTGSKDTADGGADMDLGLKIELGEQQGWVPETAVITSISLPTGGSAFSADRVQPLVNFLYSWEINECVSVGGSSGLASLYEEGDGFVEAFQSITTAVSLTDAVGAYFEWFAFFRQDAADNGPEHFLNGGLTYLFNPNLQVDWRAGFGLNERAANFFTGSGFAVRY